jgi:hypothetical protein
MKKAADAVFLSVYIHFNKKRIGMATVHGS